MHEILHSAAFVEPTFSVVDPIGQTLQSDAPVASAYVPKMQESHNGFPLEADDFPMLHGAHDVDPADVA